MTVASSWTSWWPPSTGHTSTWTSLTNALDKRVRKRSRDRGKPVVVFTDPDGTLLELRTHPCVPARDALRFLADHDVPIVLCSNRTRAELELLQQEFHLRHPFIMRKVPTARVTSTAGSSGWAEAILSAVEAELQKVSGRR